MLGEAKHLLLFEYVGDKQILRFAQNDKLSIFHLLPGHDTSRLLKKPVLLVAGRTGIPACLLFSATYRRGRRENSGFPSGVL